MHPKSLANLGDDHVAEALGQVCTILRHGQYGHDFGGGGNVEAGLMRETTMLASPPNLAVS
jgi:hypothetical protein